jgi:hypothetical protein
VATTINASSTAGLVQTADTSTILQLQTNGTTAITVDASQNVGIGTVTPSFPSGTGLAIYNSSAPRLKFTNSTTGDASTDGTQLLVSGSDFYIQQREAASVFISTNGTNAVTVDSGGGFKVLNTIGVGNATPSTSGAGITFPATQSASSNANTLDDYEEGVWTPSLGGNTTYGRQQGTYTKIGRIVYITGRIDLTSLGTGSNSTISGLPFTSKADFQEQGLSVGYFGDLAVNTTFLAPRVIGNSTTITAVGIASSGATMSALNIFGNSTVLIFTGCYEIA